MNMNAIGSELGGKSDSERQVAQEQPPRPLSVSWVPSLTRILMIDDDANLSQVLSDFLVNRGFSVTVACNGEQGVAIASAWVPDLVICDLDMPEMSGYEVLANIRRDERLTDTPFLILSGFTAPDQVRLGMNLGADDYLLKPIKPEEFLAAVNARLNLRQSQRQAREHQMKKAMELFACAIHDLRDPISVILGYTDILQQTSDEAGQLPRSGKDVLDRMHKAISRMQSIVSEVLLLTKSRLRQLPFAPCSFDLGSFCAEMVADHEKCQRLRFISATAPNWAQADPTRLRQAIENLLANALKYSDGLVTLQVRAVVEGYDIIIKDDGIGIPETEQSRLFEPFFRASNTVGKDGHGLGLCVVKSCIEQHGGNIQIRSELNKGTEVTLHLPAPTPIDAGLSDAPQKPYGTDLRIRELQLISEQPKVSTQVDTRAEASIEPVSQPLAAHLESSEPALMSALLVEDDTLVRSVLRDLLENSGMVTILGEAGTVADARLQIAKQTPDVVFLDINLPDSMGFDLLPCLSSQTLVVFTTGAEEYATRAFDCEAVDFLLKPFSQQRLGKTLLRLQHLRMALRAPAKALQSTPAGFFLLKTFAGQRLVSYNEIKVLVACGEYSWVHWGSNEKALHRMTLSKWQSKLPGDRFVRVHRNAIIHLSALECIEKRHGGESWVYLRNMPEPISVSSRRLAVLNEKIRQFALEH